MRGRVRLDRMHLWVPSPTLPPLWLACHSAPVGSDGNLGLRLVGLPSLRQPVDPVTATAYRAASGRFAPRPPIAVCGCGWTLAESLAGYVYCPSRRCPEYRQPAGDVPGVRLGVLTAADVEPET